MALGDKARENKSTGTADDAQRATVAFMSAVGGYGLVVILFGYNAFAVLPLPEVKTFYFAILLACGFILVSGLLLGPILGKIMDLGPNSWLTYAGCTGVLMGSIAIMATLLDLTSATSSSRSASKLFNIIGLGGMLYLYTILTNTNFARAFLNIIIVTISIIIPLSVGVTMFGNPKQESIPGGKITMRGLTSARATKAAIEEFKQEQKEELARQEAARNEYANRWGGNSHDGGHSSSTEGQAPPPPKPLHEQYFEAVRAARTLPALSDAIDRAIQKYDQVDKFGFSAQIAQLNETWDADQRAIVIDALLQANLSQDVQPIYISLLADSNDAVAGNAINKYLFQQGLKSPEIALRSLARLPDEALNKLSRQQDIGPVVDHFLQSVSESQAGADSLVPIIIKLGGEQSIKKLQVLALKPNMNARIVDRIVQVWKTRESDPIPPATQIYLDAKISGDSDPFTTESIQALGTMDIEPAVQSQIAELLFNSYRKNPSPEKLKALTKWSSDQLQNRVSKKLLDINKPGDLFANGFYFTLATSLKVTEPLDHVLDISLASPNQPPQVVTEYLKLDRPRMEKLLLDKLERKGYNVDTGSREISLLEVVGLRDTRQLFASMARDMKLSTEERRRFTEANDRLARSANIERQTITSTTATLTFTPSGVTIESAAPPTLNFNSDPAPKPVERIKVVAGDVAQVRSGEKTERVIITKVEPDILTVVFIDRGDKLDFIGHERVLKILGKSDDKELIKPLGSAETPASASSSTTTTPAAAAPSTEAAAAKPASAPENAKRPVAGLKIEAKKHGEWHAATIERVSGDNSYVTFDGKGSGWDGWLGLNDIRPIGARKTFLMLSFEQ